MRMKFPGQFVFLNMLFAERLVASRSGQAESAPNDSEYVFPARKWRWFSQAAVPASCHQLGIQS